MKKNDEKNSNLSRRDLLKSAAAGGLAFTAGVHVTPHAAAAAPTEDNPIRKENAKPGTRDWLLTKTRTLPGKINKILPDGRSPWIEGYCSANSVRAGETLRVMVSTNPVSDFKLEIFRTGYYNGDGARLMKRFDSLTS